MTCHACNTAPADSDEHVFASALGGRLTYPILCKNCNSGFGDTIDAALVDDLHPLRVVLGIEGDRGQTGSLGVTDEDGRAFILRPGGVPETAPAAPVIEQQEGASHTVRVTSVRAARDYLAALERKNPGAKFNIMNAEIISTYPGEVGLNVKIGGDDFFRSVVKSALAFAIGRGCPLDRGALANAWAYVRGADARAPGIRVDVTNAPAPWSDESLAVIAHRLAVDVRDGWFRADVRHFGDLAIAVEFEVPAETTPWCGAYGVDPVTRASAFGVPSPIAPRPEVTDEDLRAAFRDAIVTVMTFATERMKSAALESMVGRAVREAFAGIPEGAEITEEVVEKLSNKAAEDFTRLIFREDARRPAPHVLDELRKPK